MANYLVVNFLPTRQVLIEKKNHPTFATLDSSSLIWNSKKIDKSFFVWMEINDWYSFREATWCYCESVIKPYRKNLKSIIDIGVTYKTSPWRFYIMIER